MPTLSKQHLLIAGALILAAILPLAVGLGLRTSERTNDIGGEDIFTRYGATGLLGAILMFLGQAFLIYTAFEVNSVWGLAVFFIPFAAILFLILYWRRCRDALLFFASGAVFLILRLVLHTWT
jgi:hypothetical protein